MKKKSWHKNTKWKKGARVSDLKKKKKILSSAPGTLACDVFWSSGAVRWQQAGGVKRRTANLLNQLENQFVPQSPASQVIREQRRLHPSRQSLQRNKSGSVLYVPTGCRLHRTEKVSGNLWPASNPECKYLQEVQDKMDELETEG